MFGVSNDKVFQMVLVRKRLQGRKTKEIEVTDNVSQITVDNIWYVGYQWSIDRSCCCCGVRCEDGCETPVAANVDATSTCYDDAAGHGEVQRHCLRRSWLVRTEESMCSSVSMWY